MARPEHLRHLADDLWLVADELSGPAALPGMDADTLASLVEIIADSARTLGLDRLPLLTTWMGENLQALDAGPDGAETARALIAGLLTAAQAYCLEPANPVTLAALAARLSDPVWPNPLPRTLLNNLAGLFQVRPVDGVDVGAPLVSPEAATAPAEEADATGSAGPDAEGTPLADESAPAPAFGGTDEPIPLVEPFDEGPTTLLEAEVGDGWEPAAGGPSFTSVAIPAGVEEVLVDDFFQEAPDLATELGALLRSSEEGALVGEAVAEARRLAHTIKGDAALLEEVAVETLTHRLEDVLDHLGQEPPEPALAGLLVEAADALDCLFEGIERGVDRVELDLQPLLDALQEWGRHLDAAEAVETGPMPQEGEFPAQAGAPFEVETTPVPGGLSLATDPGLDPALFDAFLTDAPGPAEALIEQVRLQGGVLNATEAREAAGLARAIQGAAVLIGLAPMADLADGLRQALDRSALRGGDGDLASWLVAGVEVLEQQFAALGEAEAPESADPTAVIQALAAWVGATADGWELPPESGDVDEPPPEAGGLGIEAPADGEPAGWTSVAIDPAVDPRLVDAFFQEAPDQVAELALLLRGGELDAGAVMEAQRLAHTVKGSAALLGIAAIEGLCHRLEDVMELLGDGGVPAGLGDLLIEVADCLEALVDSLIDRHEGIELDLGPLLAGLGDWHSRLAGPEEAGEAWAPEAAGGDASGDKGSAATISLAPTEGLDHRLWDAFLCETPGQAEELIELLRSRHGVLSGADAEDAERLAHTVKGAAGLTGILAMARLAEALEDCLECCHDQATAPELAALLCQAAEALEGQFDHLGDAEAPAEVAAPGLIQALGLWTARLAPPDEGEAGLLSAADLMETGGVDLRPSADLNPRLWEAFLEETPAQAEQLIATLRSAQGRLTGEPAHEAERLAHTVKGSANLIGVPTMGRLAEAMEDALEVLEGRPADAEVAALLLTAAGVLEYQFGYLGEASAPADADPVSVIRALADWTGRMAAVETEEETDAAWEVEAPEAGATEGLDLRPAADLNPRLWEAFLEETPGQAEQLIDTLRAAEGRLTGEAAHEGERLAHTVKGAANLIGVPAMGRLAEAMEDALEVLAGRPADDEVAALLLAAIGVLEMQFGYLGEAAAPIECEPSGVVAALADWTGRMAAVETEEEWDAVGQGDAPEADQGEAPEAEQGEAPEAGQGEAPEAGATNGVDLRPSADLNPRLWEAFLTETPGQAEQLIDTLRAAEGRLTGEAAHETERLAHTVKGAANLIGVPAMGRLAEAMEDALEVLADRPADGEVAALLLAAIDILEMQFGYLGEESAPAECDPAGVIPELAGWTARMAPAEGAPEEGGASFWEGPEVETAPAETTGIVAAGWTDLRVSPDVDPRLVEAFFQETPDQAAELAGMLRDAGAGALAGERVTVAQRLAHTVKGSAALLGIGSIEGLAHRLEDVMELLGESAPSADLAELLVEVADVLEALFDALAQRLEGADLDIEHLLAALGDWVGRLGGSAEAEAYPEAAGDWGAAPSVAGAVNLMPAADLDPRLWEAFLSETPAQAEELIETLKGTQGRLTGEAAHEAERLAHTVKGSANLIGVPAMGRLAEAIEDALEALIEVPADDRVAARLVDAVGVLENQFAYLGSEGAPGAANPEDAILALAAWRATLSAAETPSEVGAESGAEPGLAWTVIGISPDVDSRLVEAFFQEAPDQAAELASMLRGAGEGALSAGRVTEAQRLAHTVKGSAALLGIGSVEAFAHRLEDVMELLGETAPPPELVDLLVEVADALEGLFDAILQRLDGVAIDTQGLVRRLSDWVVRLGGQPETPVATQGETGTVPSDDLLWAPDTDPKELDRFFLEIPERAERLAVLLERGQIGVEDRRKEAVDLATRMHTAGERVGIKLLTEFSGNLRTILANSGDLSAAGMEALTENSVTLREVMAAVQGMVEPSEDFWERVQLVADWAKRLTKDGAPAKPIPKLVAQPAAPQAAEAKDKDEGIATTLRVPTQRIDALMRLVGEMTTSVAQVQGRLQTVLDRVISIHRQSQVTSQKFVDLQGLVEARSIPASMAGPETRKPSADLGADEFDPLEMDQYHEIHSISSALSEAFADGLQLSHLAEDDLTELAAIAHHQGRISREVNEAVLATRMIPVNVLTPRLERAVRESCRASGKQADLHIEGDQLLVDTDIINGLRDPLMHLLRNSVDHGIEKVADRLARGKTEAGRIDVSFRRQGNVILVRIRDDGGGFNVARIRATAAKRGLQIAADVSEAEVIRLILQPGFSTKEAVTKLSGRGIGMDVVAQAVRALKGSIILSNLPGGGSETLLRLPLTLVSVPVLLVGSVGQVFAVPGDDIDQLLYPEPGAIAHSDEQGWTFRRGDSAYPLRSLNALIGREAEDAALARHTTGSILLVHDELGQQAVALDIAIERRDVVVQRLGQWLPQVHGINGACILADGSVAPALDMRALISDRSAHLELPPLPAEAATQRQITVMVVDDSLSARQALQIAMEAQGYRVVSAKDGLDAIGVLDEESPEIVLTDMEMPRMNGLEFTRHIRAQPETRHLPVVMITSRSTVKHRQQAEKAGVDEYVTKPFDNDDLAALVRTLLERPAVGQEAPHE